MNVGLIEISSLEADFCNNGVVHREEELGMNITVSRFHRWKAERCMNERFEQLTIFRARLMVSKDIASLDKRL